MSDDARKLAKETLTLPAGDRYGEFRTHALARALLTALDERDELARCVMNGWTSPAFARGPLHERAVEIARKLHGLSASSGSAPAEADEGKEVPLTCSCECGKTSITITHGREFIQGDPIAICPVCRTQVRRFHLATARVSGADTPTGETE